MRQKLTFLLGLFISLAATSVNAQCDPRYNDDIFTTVNVTSNITYGSAINYNGSTEVLSMDFYEPAGDTLSERPLIILAHGGFFSFGGKTDADIVSLCNAYARKGYACASIEYRLGWSGFLPDSIQLGEALIRGVQDSKAAVRFFKADAAGAGNYRIDPDQIFMGGSSAGAFIGVHHGFFTDLTLAPLWAQTLTIGLGGLEGNSGTPGFDSGIKGVISYAGAIVDTSWMSGSDVSIVSTHSMDDGTVPYGIGPVVFLFFPLVNVMGSSVVHAKADELGAPNAFLSFATAGHVPHISSTAAFNSTVDFTTAFLLDQLDCGCPTPTGDATVINSSTSATLSWNPVDVAVGYQLMGGPVGGPIRKRQTTATSLSITILEPSTTYAWQLRTYCGLDEGFSEPTAGQIFTTPAVREANLETGAIGHLGNEIIIEAWPNPTTDLLQVKSPGAGGWFSITDLSGRTLLSWASESETTTAIPVSQFPAGLYFLNWENSDSSTTLRLQIE